MYYRVVAPLQQIGEVELRVQPSYRGVATEKGTRSAARLNGLLPPSRAGLLMEVDRALTFVNRCGNDLDKFQVAFVVDRNGSLSPYCNF